MTGGGQEGPDSVPDDLLARLDSLDESALEDLKAYIEERIEASRQPLEDAIAAEASGEVLSIEKQGGHALVRKHPPNPDGPGADTGTVSLYKVRPEQYPDGSRGLHWTYVGDVHNAEQHRCPMCGRTFDDSLRVCPHCGGDESEDSVE